MINKHSLFKTLRYRVIFTQQEITNTEGFIFLKSTNLTEKEKISESVGKSLGDFCENKIQP